MWDMSWKPLEHPEFTDKPFIEGDDKNWWNIPYTMSESEMNSFNDAVDDLDVKLIHPYKFNGCGLVISSEVIKSGVNIPKSSFFIHEDTSFMIMLHKILENIPQYHFSNILLVHNRKHKNKRKYVLGELNDEYIDKKRKRFDWYNVANKMCEQNNANLFNANYKSFTWEDVWANIK
jgi:GT2 family glycosyltransferase